MLDDLDFSANSHFDKEAQVLRAPELDDLDDTDNLVVMHLAGPSASERRIDPLRPDAYRDNRRRRADGPARAAPQTADRPGSRSRADRRDGGRCRRRRRALRHRGSRPLQAQTVLAAQPAATNGGGPISTSGGGMQMVTVQPAANVAVHNAELAHGVAFAQERAQREAGCSSRCSSCRPRASSPRASATGGASCTPASTSRTRSAHRSTRSPTASSSTRARPPATACGSSCGTPTARSRCTATSTPRWSASVSG